MARRKSGRSTETTVVELNATAIVLAALVVVLVGAGAWWLLAGRSAPGGTTGPQAAPTHMSSAPVGTASPVAAPSTSSPPSVADAMVPQDKGAWLTSDGFAALGSPTAPVSLVVFSDFQCPNCKQFAAEVLPWLEQTWLPRGLATVVLRDFAVLGPESVSAAEAAHCAGEQGRYMAYYDKLFANQGTVAKPFERQGLVDAAAAVGSDTAAFATCLDSGRYRARVQESTQYGLSQGFEGTPTYLVNGRKVAGAIDVARWDELFKAYEQDLGRATSGVP